MYAARKLSEIGPGRCNSCDIERKTLWIGNHERSGYCAIARDGSRQHLDCQARPHEIHGCFGQIVGLIVRSVRIFHLLQTNRIGHCSYGGNKTDNN